ncbi:phosphoribosyl-ATP diphosphatase [Nanoarchaeota archaeon]
MEILTELEKVIEDRKQNPKEGSYTNKLLEDKSLSERKVSEESFEVIEASKDNDKKQVIYEAGDLLYHLLVLLNNNGVKLEEVEEELKNRRK